MPETIYFERNIFGRLYDPKIDQFVGGIGDIAYSKGITADHQVRIEKFIKLGLSNITINETDIFGFYEIGGQDFMAVHSQLMTKAEDTKRGTPVFSEFVLVTKEQLQAVDWDLMAVFDVFESRSEKFLLPKRTNELEPYQIDLAASRSDTWFMELRTNAVRVEAVLTCYLGSPEKVNILGGPQDSRDRLRFLCALLKVFPVRCRHPFNFSTFSSPANTSTRLIFSGSRQSYHNQQVVDWAAPKIAAMSSGRVYAGWVSTLLEKTTEPKAFEDPIEKLRSSTDEKHYKSLGDELDAVVGYLGSPLEHLKAIGSREELRQFIQALSLYEPLLSANEVADRLSYVLNSVMKQSAYEDGFIALSNHRPIIHEQIIREQVASKIVKEVFTAPIKDENLGSLSSFLEQMTEHALRTRQNELIDLCQQILRSALQLKEYRPALHLWWQITHLKWAASEDWFQAALEALRQVQKEEDFLFILNRIGCPPSQLDFKALLDLITNSPRLTSRLPETMRFLQTGNERGARNYLEQTAKSFQEIRSYAWLRTQVRFGYKNVSGFLPAFPALLAGLGASVVDEWLAYAAAEKDDLLTSLIAFSLLRNQIEADHSGLRAIRKPLELIKECAPEAVNAGLEIVQGHWAQFSVEQLEAVLDVLERKPLKFRNIDLNIREIRTTIQKKNRIQTIHEVFKTIRRERAGSIVSGFVSDFALSADVDAWTLFERYIRERRYIKDYQLHLLQTLVGNQFFGMEDSRLKELAALLAGAGLLYEADVFVYWLFFRKGVFLNPIPAISRTLDSYCVPFSQAGFIIGPEHTFEKKYARSLAKKVVQMEASEVKNFIEKLDDFISRQTTNSFENRLRALVSEISTEVIWVETCKLLSKYIKAEIKKI